MLKKSYEMILAEVPEDALYKPVGIDPETGESVTFLAQQQDMAKRLGGRAVLSMNGHQSPEARRHNSISTEKVITIVGQFPLTPAGLDAIRALQLHDALTNAEPRVFQPGPATPEEELYQAHLDS